MKIRQKTNALWDLLSNHGGYMKATMKILVISAILPVLFMGCASVSSKQMSAVDVQKLQAALNTSAYTGDVYVGVSGRLATRKAEAEAAKLHIARQIAMREACTVKTMSVSYNNEVTGVWSLDESSIVSYGLPDTVAILERIKIIDTYTFPDITVVVANDNRLSEPEPIIEKRDGTERPQWVPGVPESENIKFFVGSSEGNDLIRVDDVSFSLYTKYYNNVSEYTENDIFKKIIAADMNAITKMAQWQESIVQVMTGSYAAESDQDQESELQDKEGRRIKTMADVELSGFYIVDRWTDSKTCYSLAVLLPGYTSGQSQRDKTAAAYAILEAELANDVD